MPETVIKIEGLWKEYRYGVVSQGYLFRDVQSWWARVRGKEDPNRRIDSFPLPVARFQQEKREDNQDCDQAAASDPNAHPDTNLRQTDTASSDPARMPEPATVNRKLETSSTQSDRFWALRDINLEIKQGEILGIIGRNGAGKSTLLKILSRVTVPTRCDVRIKGRIAGLPEVPQECRCHRWQKPF